MKKFLKIAAAALALLIITGCSGAYSAKNAKELVKWNLDSIYLGVHDPEYIVSTGSTAAELAAGYEDGIVFEVEYFAGYAGIEYLTDDIKEELIEIYKEIYTHSSYEVGESVRTDEDTYTVSVTVYPIDVIELLLEDYENYLDDFYEKYALADVEAMTEEEYAEYDHEWALGMVAALRAQLPKIGNLSGETLSMRVELSDDGYWAINEEDFMEVDWVIISYP